MVGPHNYIILTNASLTIITNYMVPTPINDHYRVIGTTFGKDRHMYMLQNQPAQLEC